MVKVFFKNGTAKVFPGTMGRSGTALTLHNPTGKETHCFMFLGGKKGWYEFVDTPHTFTNRKGVTKTKVMPQMHLVGEVDHMDWKQ